MQRWRFFYGRMAIQKRLKQLNLIAPPSRIEDGGNSIAKKISELSGTFSKIIELRNKKKFLVNEKRIKRML